MQGYTVVNGVLRRPNQANQQQALAVVSSMDDVMAATETQAQYTGTSLQVTETVTAAIEEIQSPNYLNRFQTLTQLDGSQVLEGLSNYLARYEVPLGLIKKLLMLTEYSKLKFLIDDSGSMTLESNVSISEASQYIKQQYDPQGTRMHSYNSKLTRWEEAEDRLHIMIDLLAYIPTGPIEIHFLNRSHQQDIICLSHQGKTPEQFAQAAHQQVSQGFHRQPQGGTPIFRRVQQALNEPGKMMHYLFTDGVPDGGAAEVAEIKKLLMARDAIQHPFTFNSCSDKAEEIAWMKDLDNCATNVAEIDNCVRETQEVLTSQGSAFPFSRGFWIVCQLVAAINPHDLDALDEPRPLTKKTLDEVLGRKHLPQDYQEYFSKNPNGARYQQVYHLFAREDLIASQIVGDNGQVIYQMQQGYQSNVQGNYASNQYASHTVNSNQFFSQPTPSAPPAYNPQSQYNQSANMYQANAAQPSNPSWSNGPANPQSMSYAQNNMGNGFWQPPQQLGSQQPQQPMQPTHPGANNNWSNPGPYRRN